MTNYCEIIWQLKTRENGRKIDFLKKNKNNKKEELLINYIESGACDLFDVVVFLCKALLAL